MPSETLAAALARTGSPVELLRNLAFPPSSFVRSSSFHASVTLRRWLSGSIASSASRPMKSWSNFTKEP